MRKIILVSNFFYPEITPRAFRTTELVKEFCRQGDLVTLIIPNKSIYKKKPFENKHLTVVFSSKKNPEITSASQQRMAKSSLKNSIYSKLKAIGTYFLPKELFITYDRGITKELLNLKGNYDAIISISHPLSIHLSCALGLMRNHNLKYKTAIAEFSDPMFKGQYLNTFPANWLFGFLFSKTFKYIVVPTARAIPSFTFFKSKKNIKVIPQGFDLSTHSFNNYEPNKIITFAYAGRFYKNLRDPEYFFNFLMRVKVDFVFKLYTSTSDVYFNQLIREYQNKIKGQIEVIDLIPREKLLTDLSEMDFLINFDNENSQMVPSKLIDYAITNRPVLSFNSKTFNEKYFFEFLNRDYSNTVKINLEDYNIVNIVKAYKELM